MARMDEMNSVSEGSLPRKAVLLAAGFGSRMRPLTWSCPKPLVPIWGVPLAEHLLRMLRRWGVEEVCINLHQGAGTLRDAVSRMHAIPKISFSEEREILGTGGALRPMRSWLGNEPFWMLNADIAVDLEPEQFIDALNNPDVIAALWVTPDTGPRTVDIDAGRIRCFRSRDAGSPGTATFCGLQLLRPEIVDFLPESPFCSIVEAYEAALLAGRSVIGVAPEDAYWQDAGTLERCLSLHEEVRDAASQGKPGGSLYVAKSDASAGEDGFVSLGRGVVLGEDVELLRCIIGDGVVVEARSRVTDAIVAPGCRLSGEVEGLVAPASAVREPWLEGVLSVLALGVDDATVQGLGARGSDREFWRVVSGCNSAIVVRRGDKRAENARYAGHSELLARAGVAVPEVLAELCGGVLLMRDLGSCSLERLMKSSPVRGLRLYRDAICNLVRVQREGTALVVAEGVELEPAFGESLYRWEHDLFVEHFIGQLGWDGADVGALYTELGEISGGLSGCSPVLLHRDLQSSNILVSEERCWLIDFQGMRMGPAAYDVASLLCDPYVMLNAPQRAELMEFYHNEGGIELGEDLPRAAVQRLCQALGAFGRLSQIAGMSRYAGYIPPAGEMLEEMLAELGGSPMLRRAARCAREFA